jgi:serine phosphatase RsbU (regulator of sigma subunit)
MSASDEQFGEDRLRLFLESHPDGPAADFADDLLQHLSSWRGRAAEQEPDDDVTLLAVHFQVAAGDPS